MLAYVVRDFSGDSGLAELPVPEPGPGEVRLRIRACGLNFADTLMRAGRYQERPEPPFVLGMEVAGEVEAVGPGVSAPLPGARVAVFAASGGLAERGVFRADRCLPIPDAMDFATAAAFQIAYGTGHMALMRRARLRPGETLLVTGAAGATGLAAVEIGAAVGARVIAVARGAAKLAVARDAGAEVLIDAETPDLRAELRALGGIDVAYDTVGGEMFTAALRAARPEGRLIPIGFAGGEVPQIAANHLLVKNLSVLGVYWGGYFAFAPDVARAGMAELLDWHAAGRIRPVVGERLPLARAEEALGMLRGRASAGKIVIEP